MSAFFLLYALTITLELILSLVMAVFLFLIVAPRGGVQLVENDAPPAARPMARTVEGALGDAFAAVSEGRDDPATITNALSLLARYAQERERERRSAG